MQNNIKQEQHTELKSNLLKDFIDVQELKVLGI